MQHEISNKIMALCVVVMCITLFSAAAQGKQPIVYELGPSMIELMIEQSAYEGASPAELEGMRQGFELQLAETSISVTFLDDKKKVMLSDGQSHELSYVKSGLKLKAINPNTAEAIEIGFFSKDRTKLTVFNRYILDLKQ